MRTWDHNETMTFLEATSEDRLYALYLLTIHTGLREGEVLGLRWQDIDLERGVLSVRQTVVRIGAKIAIGQPKSKNSYRTVALSNTVVQALKSHRRIILSEQLQAGSRYESNDLVFPTTLGTLMNPSNLRREFIKAKKKANVPDIRFHDLRHTSATLMLAGGVHPKVVSERLGHHTASFTLDKYSHVLPNMQEEASNTLDQMLRKKKQKEG